MSRHTQREPYYAVIFTSTRTDVDQDYARTAARMRELAQDQPGFLGFESARGEVGISVSYWESLEAIAAWKNHPEHRAAQARAGEWYRSYRVRVCRVEREYDF
jgi:heme-degrading monooxygenase HmoA